MGFEAELLAEFDRDLAAGAAKATTAMVTLTRGDSAMPKATGQLAAGIEAQAVTVSAGKVTADIVSTGKAEGTDYGHILDTSRGQTIRPVTKKALANTGSGWGPYASARLTTKHVGWIEKAMSQANWDKACERGFGPLGL